MAKNGNGIHTGQKTNLFLTKTMEKTKRAILFVGFFSLFINILMLTVPIYMLQIFDRVLPSHSFETLIYLTLMAGFMLAIFGFLDRTRSHIMIRVSAWIGEALGPEALMRGPDKILYGEQMVAQAMQDINKLRAFLSSPAVGTLFDVPWIPIYIAVIFMLHTTLGVIALVGAILLLSLALLNEISTRRLTEEASMMQMKTQNHINATLKNAEVIQAMGMMPSIVDNWIGDNQLTTQKQTQASLRASSILSTSKMLRLMLQVIMLGAGAYYVVQNVFTPGVMIAGTILLSRALAPVEQGISAWKQYIIGRDAYHRLQHYFTLPLARPDSMPLPPPLGKIEVENCIFVPPGVNKAVIDGLNFSLEPGESMAVIGPSAAGKTTLSRLLIGAWRPTRGHVRLDGADIYEWDREDFGRYIGYLPQDVELFTGSIKDNIARLGKADPEEVVAAAKLAEAHEMILNLEHGYDTNLTVSEQALSGGQRQRVALARALYKRPKLVVLDEPNSNLDDVGLKALIESIDHLREIKSTVILVTHQMSLLQTVDKILVLQEGRMLAFGPRDQILKKLSGQQSRPPQSGLSANFAVGS